MVNRKTSKAVKIKNKPSYIESSDNNNEEEEETRKEAIQKRLDDFDMQVHEISLKMEADKESVINTIKHLYYIDEQRTSVDVNNMLWQTFLTQNNPCPRSQIRESIAELILKVEDKQMTSRTRKQAKRKGGKNMAETPTIALHASTPLTRSSRSRQLKNDSESNTEDDIQIVTTKTRTRNTKTNNQLKTPMDRGLPILLPSDIITPKFNPRTPLPMSSLRKPRFGEIAVSLKGSPLLVSSKKSAQDPLDDVDLELKTKEELQHLHQKVSELLKM